MPLIPIAEVSVDQVSSKCGLLDLPEEKLLGCILMELWCSSFVIPRANRSLHVQGKAESLGFCASKTRRPLYWAHINHRLSVSSSRLPCSMLVWSVATSPWLLCTAAGRFRPLFFLSQLANAEGRKSTSLQQPCNRHNGPTTAAEPMIADPRATPAERGTVPQQKEVPTTPN